jgi:hypothetical protein
MVHPFEVTGDQRWVVMHLVGRGKSKLAVRGFTSPLQPITLQGESRRRAGVPRAATAVAFVYPLPVLKGSIDKLAARRDLEAWLVACVLGGFCYFDATGACPNPMASQSDGIPIRWHPNPMASHSVPCDARHLPRSPTISHDLDALAPCHPFGARAAVAEGVPVLTAGRVLQINALTVMPDPPMQATRPDYQ